MTVPLLASCFDFSVFQRAVFKGLYLYYFILRSLFIVTTFIDNIFKGEHVRGHR